MFLGVFTVRETVCYIGRNVLPVLPASPGGPVGPLIPGGPEAPCPPVNHTQYK